MKINANLVKIRSTR